MTKRMNHSWHLRRLMAERGMYQTSDLVPLLAEWGVVLSREQVFRLVTQPPQRMSLDTLAALCGILECGVQDLIEMTEADVDVRAPKAAVNASAAPPPVRRTTIRRPNGI